MEPLKEIEHAIKKTLNATAATALHDRVLARLRQAQRHHDDRTSARAEPVARRIIMKRTTSKLAVAAAVIAVALGVGAISVVAVNIGRYYYYGKNDAGAHIFHTDDWETVVTLDDNEVTDIEQTRRDLEEIESLRQHDNRKLLQVETMTTDGTLEIRTHVYEYRLSDGRTIDMREGAGGEHSLADAPLWEEWLQLKKAGPGEDLGTHEETVEGRVFTFKRERYHLSDGTEVIWSVGTPKEGQ